MKNRLHFNIVMLRTYPHVGVEISVDDEAATSGSVITHLQGSTESRSENPGSRMRYQLQLLEADDVRTYPVKMVKLTSGYVDSVS